MKQQRLIFIVLIFIILGSVTVYAEDEEPQIDAYSNAPGWITIVWEHSMEDVYGFVVERQSPPYADNTIVAVAVLNAPTTQFTDMNLQPETMYNHRVCAVYAYNRTCSNWKSTTTLSGRSSRNRAEPPPPPPPPAPLSTPVLKATATGTKNILLEWDYRYEDNLTSMALYRDDQQIFDGAIPGNFTRSHVDVAPKFNTEYTYKLCFSNPNEQNKCSDPVTVIGQPVEPTAPADFNAVKIQSGGGSAMGGSVMLRPKSTINASWRNTDVSGQFITLEALDKFGSDEVIMGGAARTAPKEAWIETTRVSAKTDPTSLNASVARSLISNEINLTTYRVCAVVPQLGEKGKVCSGPITVQ